MVRLKHSAVWAKASCQRVSRDILIDPDQDAAGFDQDMRWLARGKTEIVSGSRADNRDHINTRRDRHRNLGTDRALHDVLDGSGEMLGCFRECHPCSVSVS